MAETGETDLNKMLVTLEPILKDGVFVFTTVSAAERDKIPNSDIQCEFKETEGITLVLQQAIADKYDFVEYSFVCSWIQLSVHSSLDAVGLTAAFSTALTQEGISCNVIAGFYHDHIFVNLESTEKAMRVLRELPNIRH